MQNFYKYKIAAFKWLCQSVEVIVVWLAKILPIWRFYYPIALSVFIAKWFYQSEDAFNKWLYVYQPKDVIAKWFHQSEDAIQILNSFD